MNNVINFFMSYKIKSLKKYSEIIGKEIIDNSYNDNYFERYYNTYINTYYYHVLGTLDYSNDIKYNFSTVKKELEGMYYEILYDIENSDILEDIDVYNKRKKQNKICYDIALFIINLDKLKIYKDIEFDEFKLLLDEVIEKHKFIQELINVDICFKLYEEIIDDTIKCEKYLSQLNELDFSIKYKNYLSTDYYLVLLDHHIKRLKTNYKQSMIDRVYKFDNVSIDRIKTMINLVSIDILKKLINGEEIDTYFIWFSDICFSKKELFEEYLVLLDNPLLKKKIVILINSNYYINHQKLFDNYKNYTYASITDMSHINDVDKKLEALNNYDIFKYIILDKVKSKDYEYVSNYECEKEIFFNEFKKV